MPPISERPPSFYSENQAQDIATDEANVYWTEVDRGRVRKAAKAGGVPVDLATKQRAPWHIALVGSSVIFDNEVAGVPESSIVSVPKSGGQSKTLVSGIDGISEMSADETGVYYVAAEAIEHIPLAGGARAVIARGFIHAVALDASNVYWLASDDPSPGPIAVRGRAKQGGSIVTLATHRGDASDMAVDEDRLYFLATDGVFAVPKSGGTPVRVTQSIGVPSDLVVHEGVLYFAAHDILSGNAAYEALLRAPANGGVATVVTWGEFLVGTLAVDDDGIWWSTAGDAMGLVKTPL